jgi:hypothetical protein
MAAKSGVPGSAPALITSPASQPAVMVMVALKSGWFSGSVSVRLAKGRSGCACPSV